VSFSSLVEPRRERRGSDAVSAGDGDSCAGLMV
jgi:hypothetical protein